MTLGLAVIFVLTWTLCSIMYNMGVLPCLRDRGRFELFALRDELRDLAINCQADANSFAFRHLEAVLNRMTKMCNYHTVSNMMFAMIMYHVDENTASDFKRFDAEASKQLKHIERRALDSMMRVMFANSPMFVMFAGLIYLTSEACKRSMELKNRLLWHECPAMTA